MIPNEKLRVQVSLFGAFRAFSSSSHIEIEVLPSSTVAEVKAELGRSLEMRDRPEVLEKLLGQSAIASESRILKESDPVLPEMRLAVLPPVCGG